MNYIYMYVWMDERRSIVVYVIIINLGIIENIVYPSILTLLNVNMFPASSPRGANVSIM